MSQAQKDFLIALAWPEGLVTSSGAWYDFFLAKKGKYRVGHSAIVLVDSNKKKCHYFDFGRYHTPFNKGRVRDNQTDPDVTINSKVEIKQGEIKNIDKILREVSSNKATHGEGRLYASVLKKVSFKKAYKYAKKIQKKGMVLYGPFILQGTNCSRFVASTIRFANPKLVTSLRLRIPFCVTPSPKRNISIVNNNYYVVENDEVKKIKKTKIKAYFSSIETWEQ